MLEMFITWQAFTVAAAASLGTGALKAIVDVVIGKDERKASRWLNRFAFKALPSLIAAAVVAFLPVRPDALVEMTAGASDLAAGLSFALWGAVLGQLAGKIFDDGREWFGHRRGA
jgi:hypothetical protein